MHVWRLWTAIGVFAAFTAGAAVIYKWTDVDGVVHYSDQATSGAEKIVTSSSTSNGIGGATAPASSGGAKGIPATAAKAAELTIDSPSQEQVFFGDDVIPVHLRVVPALRPTQIIAWHLNGRELTDQSPDAISLSLQGLARGTYAIAATVTESDTGQAQSTQSVTFYVRQPSELAPQHKKS